MPVRVRVRGCVRVRVCCCAPRALELGVLPEDIHAIVDRPGVEKQPGGAKPELIDLVLARVAQVPHAHAHAPRPRQNSTPC